jgi:hypothetical protein
MPDQHTYLIELRGVVDVVELNARAPLKVLAVRADSTTTMISAAADQAGLIGLLRHWHGLGFQFISITCESQLQESGHVEIKTGSSG